MAASRSRLSPPSWPGPTLPAADITVVLVPSPCSALPDWTLVTAETTKSHVQGDGKSRLSVSTSHWGDSRQVESSMLMPVQCSEAQCHPRKCQLVLKFSQLHLPVLQFPLGFFFAYIPVLCQILNLVFQILELIFRRSHKCCPQSLSPVPPPPESLLGLLQSCFPPVNGSPCLCLVAD